MTVAPASPLIEISDLRVAFGHGEKRALAVDGIDLRVERGEAVALVGESGSGKSVTALSILRLLPYPMAHHPSGRIIFDGADMLSAPLADLRELRGHRIGMVFQEPMTSLNPLHTIERQIGEALTLHRMRSASEVRTRILELLDLVGIRDAENRLTAYPHQLSGGQRQRVMIAMALANDPELLIADEPTTALDVTIQAQILALLHELRQRLGMALLLITHDLGIVRKMADRVYVMRQGKVVEQAETERVFELPEHPYTRALLAAEPSGQPAPVAAGAPVVVAAENVKVWFPIKRGLLRRTFDHVKAVDGLSLQVREGQTLGVVGESGSGKTTFGLALLGLIASQGEVRVRAGPFDQSLDSLSASELRSLRRQMQIVFQDPYGSLSPRMTVEQIVGEGLEVHRIGTQSERKQQISEVLEEVGLEATMRDRYPHEFSGGQRQRIAIARAMVLRPRFLVLDEPTSALDMSIQAQIVELLRELQARHSLAYLFISHDLKVVRAMSHEVAVMREGVIVERGPTESIFERPEQPYTRALIAAAFDIEAVEGAPVRD